MRTRRDDEPIDWPLFWAMVVVTVVSIAVASRAHCAQFTAFDDRHDPSVLLQGHWQSCRVDGEYAERVYEHVVHGKLLFELHLGPKDDFGVFAGPTDGDELDDHDHGNLLAGHRYGAVSMLNGHGREWTFEVDGQPFRLSVVLAGGSRDECESYVLLLEKRPQR